MKHKKLKELNHSLQPLTADQKLKIKGGVGNDDLDVMIGSDDIEPIFKVIDDLDII